MKRFDWLKPIPGHAERHAQMNALVREYGWRALGLNLLLWLLGAWSLHQLDKQQNLGLWLLVVGIALIATQITLLSTYVAIPYVQEPQRSKQFGTLFGVVGAASGVLGGFVGAVIGAAVRKDRTVVEVLTDPRLQGMAGIVVVGAIIITLAVNFVVRQRVREAELEAELAQRERDQAALAKQTGDAQLKLLQAQVEPHFLYNTLANLRYLVQVASPDALRMTDHLIDYLRVSLPSFRADHTPLKQEFELVQSYLAIMAIRQAGTFTYHVDLPSTMQSIKVPPLMVLTLVENAIKHGIARSEDGGHIDICATCDTEVITIRVADTGAGLDAQASTTAAPGTGVGLANVRERLATLYGDAAALTLQPNRPKGVIATLVLPA